MERIRKRIDEINKKLDELLEERFILTKQMGDYKKINNLPVENIKRENEILNNIKGIYSQYKKDIFQKIFQISKEQQNEKNSIILIGMPMCGKTTIGEKLAKDLNMNFLDIDKYIEEKFEMSITEMFKKYGENFFRSEEEKFCENIPKGFVIATGGGTPLLEKNQKNLKNNGIIIYLKRNCEFFQEEIKKRPMFLKKSYEELLSERVNIYENIADFIVENNNSIENCINFIKKQIIN